MADDMNVPTQLAQSSDIVTRLLAVLDAIDALHQRPEPPVPQDQWPTDAWFVPWCPTCSVLCPCPTARLLIHPMTLDEAIDTLGTVHK